MDMFLSFFLSFFFLFLSFLFLPGELFGESVTPTYLSPICLIGLGWMESQKISSPPLK
jgi:hypothetical protein